MNPTQIVDINISNVSQELFNYILIDLTTMIVNNHFNTNYLPDEIYNYIYFKYNNERNLDVNNLMLIV